MGAMVHLRVKEIAKQRGISMGKLSRTADVSYKTVKRIYDDPHYSVTTNTLEKLARALGVPTATLLEDEPDSPEGGQRGWRSV
jgi:DNA-binding Xre family transcriptional regulator